jgi:hypothetical protein
VSENHFIVHEWVYYWSIFVFFWFWLLTTYQTFVAQMSADFFDSDGQVKILAGTFFMLRFSSNDVSSSLYTYGQSPHHNPILSRSNDNCFVGLISKANIMYISRCLYWLLPKQLILPCHSEPGGHCTNLYEQAQKTLSINGVPNLMPFLEKVKRKVE